VTSPEVELRRVWHRCVGGGHDQALEGLLARHREPHRRYHTATHVMWVCRHVDRLVADQVELADASAESDEIRMAALFHDAVYDPRSSTNEASSAAMAMARLAGIGWQPERRAVVAHLIELTAGHAIDPGDPSAIAASILLDADLAILGAEANEYQHYARAVRSEYAHVTETEWKVGRSNVLQGFLARDEIFLTESMRSAREHRARANLAAELASLAERS
jgi:predicted metal-dependent HD superfamily phosphohydrolase